MDKNKTVELDEKSRSRLREVRKELTKGGTIGLFGGAALGIFGHVMTPIVVPSFKVKITKNTLIASVLICASVGSFLGASVYGKNAAIYIGDIFRLGSKPTSSYQQQLHENEQEILNSMDDAFERRAASIKKAMELKRSREGGS